MADVLAIAELSVPSLVDWGKRAIEEAASFQDIRSVKAVAEAVAAYQRSIGAGQEAINAATEIKLRAERRMGEALEEGQERGEIAGAGEYQRANVPSGNVSPATHAELGLTRKEAAGYKDLAKPSADQFSTIVDAVRETGALSGGKVRDLARRAAQSNWSPDDIKRAVADEARASYRKQVQAEANPTAITAGAMGYSSNDAFQQTADLLGALETLIEALPPSPEDAARAASEGARDRLLAKIRPIIGFLSTLEDLLTERRHAA